MTSLPATPPGPSTSNTDGLACRPADGRAAVEFVKGFKYLAVVAMGALRPAGARSAGQGGLFRSSYVFAGRTESESGEHIG